MSLRAGADSICEKVNDLKWQELRDLIEAFGKEAFNAGCQAILDKLAEEAKAAVCACGCDRPCVCGSPGCG